MAGAQKYQKYELLIGSHFFLNPAYVADAQGAYPEDEPSRNEARKGDVLWLTEKEATVGLVNKIQLVPEDDNRKPVNEDALVTLGKLKLDPSPPKDLGESEVQPVAPKTTKAASVKLG